MGIVSWVYELLDRNMTMERSSLIAANVMIGLILGFSFTIGVFNYTWFLLPAMSNNIQHFATKILEPFVFI